MRRELRLVAALTALLALPPGSFAVDPAAKPAPVPAPKPTSEALCGRGEKFRALAKALDKSNPIALSSVWRNIEIDKFQSWLDAPICQDAGEKEIKLYNSRHRVLEQLSHRLERAREMEEIGQALARFRGWRPDALDWPGVEECNGCTVLHSAALQVAAVAPRWPARAGMKIGERLAEAAQREPLVAELCAAKPGPYARADLEKRFRYYSWTPGGARLLAVADWFERPEIAAGCSGR